MPNDNRISATITDEVKTQILGKFQEIMDLLPFLTKLDAGEKRGISTIGTEREAMDATFSAEMGAHPDLVPSYVDRQELARDRELRADLQEILQRAREVCEALEDTAHVAGSDVLLAYLAFYTNVKQAAERAVPGTETLAGNLGRFFPKRARPAAPAAAQG
jgi:isopropylmalate/homocitrate/citramalate synthase